MVRQAHHERKQLLAVRPEPVEGLNQRFLRIFVEYYFPIFDYHQGRGRGEFIRPLAGAMANEFAPTN
jgi:hypothetical protein